MWSLFAAPSQATVPGRSKPPPEPPKPPPIPPKKPPTGAPPSGPKQPPTPGRVFDAGPGCWQPVVALALYGVLFAAGWWWLW